MRASVKAKAVDDTNNQFMRLMGLAVAGFVLALGLLMMPAFAAGSSSDSGSSSTRYGATPETSKVLREAVAAIKREEYAAALDFLATETKANPKNADAWNFTGYASRKLGRYDASAAAYDKALAINPNHKGALEYKGELYLTLGQLDNAEAMLARLKKACTFNCSELRDLNKAINLYKKAN
ncbi:tetratricopeptide repeat protein [Alphaproteobacteria bacterium]|nr:tetratricopeptide repeat protein [Alphaproteobacteria bacterium]